MSKVSLRIAACLLFLILAGCGEATKEATPPGSQAAPSSVEPRASTTTAYEPPKPAVSDEEKAIVELKEFAADTHKKIKEKLDGKLIEMSGSGRIRGGELKVTIDDTFTYDLKKSDSLLNKFDGEIYIGYRGEMVSGFAKGLGSSEGPKAIKCNYKNGSWELDKPTLIYSDTEFLTLPKKSD